MKIIKKHNIKKDIESDQKNWHFELWQQVTSDAYLKIRWCAYKNEDTKFFKSQQLNKTLL